MGSVILNAPVNNFPQILQKTLSYEGNANFDPSGPSKFGILERNYQSYLKENGGRLKTIDKITLPEATDIYSKNYYYSNNLDKLPHRTSGVIFDWVVNSGQKNSIPAVQRIIGATPDGKIGPKTIEAINNYIGKNGEDVLIDNILNQRRDYLERYVIPKQPQNANGLRNRVNRVEQDYLRVNYGIRNLKQ